MTEFYNNFISVLKELYNMQIEDTPLVLRGIVAQVLRFGLLGLCIFSGILAVQLIISILDKNSRGKKFKNPIFIGITLVLAVSITIYAFIPISAAPSSNVLSGAFQNIMYAEDSFSQNNESEEPTTTDTANTQQETQDGQAQTDDAAENVNEENDEQEEQVNFVVASHAELTQEYTQKITTLLENTKCTRTLLRELPQEDGQNLILRTDSSDNWQVRLTPTSGYVYMEEQVDYIYIINDYEKFHGELANILQN